MPPFHCASVISNKSICGTATRNIWKCIDSFKRPLNHFFRCIGFAEVDSVNHRLAPMSLTPLAAALWYVLCPNPRQ